MEGRDGPEAPPAPEAAQAPAADAPNASGDVQPTAGEAAPQGISVPVSIPVTIEPLRESSQPVVAPPAPKPRRAWLPAISLPKLSPRAIAIAGAAAGVGLMALLVVPLAAARRAADPAASLAQPAASASAATTPAEDAGAAEPTAGAHREPTVWRVSMLQGDEDVDVIDGTVGKRPFGNALVAAGISKAEAHRVMQSFHGVRKLDNVGAKESFTIAKQKKTGKVLAFELEKSPTEIWQAKVPGLGLGAEGTSKADANGELSCDPLNLHVERKRIAVAVTVEDDVRGAIAHAGLDDDVLKMLADALEGHADAGALKAGTRLRIVATEDLVDGEFGRYVALDAVEYFPPRPKAPSVRVYWYQRGGVPMDPDEDQEHRGRHRSGGYYDSKGRQPYHGGWRSPIPLARITSRFNPKRMHPVLHVVMPHNGVDFGAASGTPIYAVAPGVVRSAGDSGPCGNMVQIDHSNGLTSAYCHMSRFAAGLHAGQHVEGRQLIGYVGATGRVTGPHLHFAVKRGDQFIDPMTLRLDGMRVLPHADRAPFAKQKEELDAELEAIALPDAPQNDADGGSGEEPDQFYEEQ